MTKPLPASFEDYLMYIYMEDYAGTDDDLSDNFSDWLGDLSGEDYMIFGEGLYNLLTK